MAWKRGDLLGVAQRLAVALVCGGLVLLAWLVVGRHEPALAWIAAAIAVIVILGTVSEIVARILRGGAGPSVAWSRARGFPLSFWGGACAHLGVGLALLGLAATGLGVEKVVTMRPGVPIQVGPLQVTLDVVTPRQGPNYQETVSHMTVRSATGDIVATVEPARRRFASRQMSTTQAGIVTLGLGQFYASINDLDAKGDVPAQLFWKPLVTLIWLGGCVMAFGALLSVADRRLRFGAPVRARATAAAPARG
jgi:cytochrome c-type biogenesis protein CcmF